MGKTRIGVLGTGIVGRTIAARLAELGHGVTIGTRDPAATLSRAEGERYGGPSFGEWRKEHPRIEVGTFAQAAAFGELLVNATNGQGSLPALEAAGRQNLEGKVLIDVSNPLDFSKGMPPSLFVCNTDSLGEQLQRAHPELRVVKTLHTVNATLMVAPRELAGGDHTMFVSGNDAAAKRTVTELLQSFGWSDIVDLGDITMARGTEMMLPIWLRAWGALQTPAFSFKLVR